MKRTLAALALSACAFCAPGTQAQDFYAGKNITFTVGFGPGGEYDVYARLVDRHFGRHIPGNPKITVVNKGGSGSAVAAAYLYGPAKRDGTEIGIVLAQLALSDVLGEPVAFDVTKLTYVGRLVPSRTLALVASHAPATTIAEAKQKEVILAASGPNSSTTRLPMALNRMMGTKFKVIRGYDSSVKMMLAIERGEVDGSGGGSTTVVRNSLGHWVAEGKIKYLWVSALDRHPALPDVPAVVELAETPEQKQVLEILTSSSSFGYAIWSTPEIPKDRLNILRRSFDSMAKDPAFLQEAEKLQLEIEPETGEYLEKVMAIIANAPDALLKRAGELSRPD